MNRRGRIMEAMIAVSRERGFAGATITAVCERARVSRRGFYEEFDGLQECFLAVMDDGRGRVSALIADAFASAEGGEGIDAVMAGVRRALALLLRFFEERPAIARVWVLESLAAGSWAIERRERNVTALTEQIVGHWQAAGIAGEMPPVATGTMAAVLGILHRRMLADAGEPLLDLLPSLMEIVAAPYLDPSAVTEQVEQARALVQDMQPPGGRSHASWQGASAAARVVREALPPALLDPRARRVRECVMYLAEHPGASNRSVADAVGIARHSQISALLTRLERLGLVCAQRGTPGRANSWRLTASGERAARCLREDGGRPITR